LKRLRAELDAQKGKTRLLFKQNGVTLPSDSLCAAGRNAQRGNEKRKAKRRAAKVVKHANFQATVEAIEAREELRQERAELKKAAANVDDAGQAMNKTTLVLTNLERKREHMAKKGY
jgi:hypothetical protein